MSFDTENRSIHDIFSRSATYIVPRYQRSYVWKEINWKELLTDIEFTIKNNTHMTWSHFLGTIVLNNIKTKQSTDEKYEIIDGQQRLMTIYILLICICKLFNELSDADAPKRAEYIHSTYLTFLTRDSNRELEIKNEVYDEVLKKLVDYASGKTEELDISGFSIIYKLFIYFYSCLEKKDFDELDSYLTKILEINIVEIISGEDEEIYNIFEVLNARGQKLRQIDLLKNHIMKYIQPRKNKFIDEAKEKWKTITDNVSNLSDPDALIQHFAKCYIEKDAENQNSIYRLIKEEVEIKDLNKFLQALVDFSKEYNFICSKDNGDENIEYFNIKTNKQIRSLLCAIFILEKRNIISDNTREKSIRFLRNFFFWFNTTQQTSNRIDKLMSSISYKIYHCETEIEFKVAFIELVYKFREYLKNKDLKYMLFDNRSFKYSNKDKTLKRNSRLVKYILVQYCNSLQTDSALVPDELSIEHLLSDDGTDNTNSIWNFTLTSQSINADELRNKSIEEKISILKDRSSIKSNQVLDKYMKNGEFDFEARKEDIFQTLYEDVFHLDYNIFHITKEDMMEYRQIESLVKEEPELLNLLRNSGKYFLEQLKNNPNNLTLKEKFIELDKSKSFIFD